MVLTLLELEGDELLEAKLTNGESEILMAIKSGRAIRFNESKVRSMGRTASVLEVLLFLKEMKLSEWYVPKIFLELLWLFLKMDMEKELYLTTQKLTNQFIE